MKTSYVYDLCSLFCFQPVEAGHEHNFIAADVNSFPVKRENGKFIYKTYIKKGANAQAFNNTQNQLLLTLYSIFMLHVHFS